MLIKVKYCCFERVLLTQGKINVCGQAKENTERKKFVCSQEYKEVGSEWLIMFVDT